MKRFTIALIAAGVVVAAGGLLSILAALGAASTNSCQKDGPFSPSAGPSAVSLTAQRTTTWPLGRECTWIRRDGSGFVTTNSGSIAHTSAAYGSFAIGLLLATSAPALLWGRTSRLGTRSP